MYETWFPFSDRPFSAAPRASSYFAAAAIQSAWDATCACLDHGSGPAIVVGETGMGKSLFAQRLLHERNPQQTSALLNGSSCRTNREFLQQLLYIFGLPHAGADDGQLRMTLSESINYHAAQGTPSLLIVDEADLLEIASLEELQGLSNQTTEHGWSLQLVLLGAIRLEEALTRPQLASLNQRITTRGFLSRWTKADTIGYIHAELHRVAGSSEAFSADAVGSVHVLTDGVPRLTAQLCDHALVLAAAAGLKQVTKDLVEEAWSDLQQLPPRTTSVAFTDARQAVPAGAGLVVAPTPSGNVANELPTIEFGQLDDENELPDSATDSTGAPHAPWNGAEGAIEQGRRDSGSPPGVEFPPPHPAGALAKDSFSPNGPIEIDRTPHDIESHVDEVIDHVDQIHSELNEALQGTQPPAAPDSDLLTDLHDETRSTEPPPSLGSESVLETGTDKGGDLGPEFGSELLESDLGDFTPGAVDTGNNPFLEEFQEEEIVFVRSAGVSAGGQRHSVSTKEGQAVHRAIAVRADTSAATNAEFEADTDEVSGDWGAVLPAESSGSCELSDSGGSTGTCEKSGDGTEWLDAPTQATGPGGGNAPDKSSREQQAIQHPDDGVEPVTAPSAAASTEHADPDGEMVPFGAATTSAGTDTAHWDAGEDPSVSIITSSVPEDSPLVSALGNVPSDAPIPSFSPADEHPVTAATVDVVLDPCETESVVVQAETNLPCDTQHTGEPLPAEGPLIPEDVSPAVAESPVDPADPTAPPHLADGMESANLASPSPNQTQPGPDESSRQTNSNRKFKRLFSRLNQR